MTVHRNKRRLAALLLAACMALGLTACGGDSGGGFVPEASNDMVWAVVSILLRTNYEPCLVTMFWALLCLMVILWVWFYFTYSYFN